MYFPDMNCPLLCVYPLSFAEPAVQLPESLGLSDCDAIPLVYTCLYPALIGLRIVDSSSMTVEEYIGIQTVSQRLAEAPSYFGLRVTY